MHFGTWNIQGIRLKWQNIIQEIQEMKMDCIVLTETKKKGTGMEEGRDYIHFYSGVPKENRAKRGVSILVKKKFKKNITNFEAIDERIIRVNMEIFGEKVVIIGVYAPNEDEKVETKENFYEKLHEVIDSIGGNRETILLGDFNGRTGSNDKDPIVGKFGERTKNDNGDRLIELCKWNDLKITNGFFEHKEIHKYTWIQHTKQLKSIIDYLIVKQRTKIKIMDVRVQRGVDCGSDHYLLRAKMIFPYKQRLQTGIPENGKTEKIEDKEYRIESLMEESTKKLFQRRLDEKLEERSFENVTELYEHIGKSLHQAAFEALGVKQQENRRRTYWWDEECKQKIQKKKEAYLKWLNTKREDNREEYRRICREVKTYIAKKKNLFWDRKCRELETYIGGRKCSEAWKFLKRVRSENTYKSLQKISTKKWEEYYSELLNEERPEFLPIRHVVKSQREKVQLTTKRTEEAIKRLKNGKASGPGGIPAELIKNGTCKLTRLITRLFEMCINERIIPEEWKQGHLTSIFKKGDRQKCENYRGITVTSTFSRLYGRILKELLEEDFGPKETEEQCGFRAGRSCVDNIFCLKQIIEKRLAVGMETHLLFIDLRKAYDCVPHMTLWKTLDEIQIKDDIVEAIKELYRNSRIKIKIGKKLSEGFLCTKGLRQGCCISPTLFKIYIEKALRVWKKKCKPMGIDMNGTKFFTLQFADDQVVLAEDKEDLEYMTRKIKEEYEKWGLSMNIGKTKYLCIGKKESNLQLEQEEIEICDNYRYLGVDINEDGRDNTEIRNRINQGRKAIGRLNGIWWSDEITRNRKKKIYNTIVKSIVMYGSETWRVTEAEKRKLLAVEMDALRRSCRISRIEKIRNEKIREMIELEENIWEYTQKKQLIWFGHVRRMNEERLPKIVMDFKPTGKRKRGRPRKTWMEGINVVMRQRNLDKNQCLDRIQWRKALELGRRPQMP